MTMAEKQYKNYDERFLKEDTSSSEPIEIEGHMTTANRSTYVLINQWPDGTPIQTADDLELVFKSQVIISFTQFLSEESGSNNYKAIPILMQRNTLQREGFCVLVLGAEMTATTEQIFNRFIDPST